MLDKRPNSAGKARNMLLVSDNRAKDVSRPRDAGSVVKLLLSSSSLLRCVRYPIDSGTVSYTHLTLPTICSV